MEEVVDMMGTRIVQRIVADVPHPGCCCERCCAAACTDGPRPEKAIWRGWEGADGVLGWTPRWIVTVEDGAYRLYRRTRDGDLGKCVL